MLERRRHNADAVDTNIEGIVIKTENRLFIFCRQSCGASSFRSLLQSAVQGFEVLSELLNVDEPQTDPAKRFLLDEMCAAILGCEQKCVLAIE